jgi:hypothetical protein
LAIAALLGADPAAACAASLDEVAISGLCEEIEGAWLEMLAEPIQQAAARLESAVPCVGEPLTPTLAARVHRARGLARVVAGDLEGAAKAFAAARYSDPGLGLPEDLAPEGTPVRDLFVRPLPYVPDASAPEPHRGTLLIDGLASGRRPTARPTAVQHLDPSGRVLGTWLLEPGMPLPPEPWRDPRRAARWTVRGLGIAGLAGAATAYGLALDAQAKHGDPTDTSLSVDDLDALRRTTNARARGAAIAGALGGVMVGLSFSGPLR